MRKQKALTTLLRGLVDLLAEEADRNPEFAARLEQVLDELPGGAAAKPKARKPKESVELPDVYAERKTRDDTEFRLWLRDLPVPVLKAIVKEHDLDPTRRVSRWKDPEKFSALIADQLQARMSRGSAFLTGRVGAKD